MVILNIGKSNFGEFLSSSTEGLVFANYSPVNDCALQDGKCCRQPRSNPCMIKFCRSLINSLIKELDRYLLDTDGSTSGINCFSHDDKIGHPGVRLVDACSVVLGKTDYLGEIRKFIEIAGYKNKYEFYAVSIITIGYHAKYYSFINDGSEGDGLLPILPSTANGRDHLLDYDNITFDKNGVFKSHYCKLFRCVPHGECWANKTYLLQWSYESMVEIGESLVGFYSCFNGIGDNTDLSMLSKLNDIVDTDLSEELKLNVKGSIIAFRYSGIAFMTPEERAELIKCRLFFYKSGTLSSFLFSGNGNSKTRQDMENGSEMASLFDEMLEYHNQKYDQVDDTMFMQKLKDKYDSMVLGGEKGGRWCTLASAFAATSPPWCRSGLTGEMESLFATLLDEDGGDVVDFCSRLKDRYNSMKESGQRLGQHAFINRVGCFKYIDDFNALFDSILRSGGDEGGEMVSAEEMEKFTRFGHVLSVLPIVSQVDRLTTSDITNIRKILLSLRDGVAINSPVYTNLQDYIELTNAEEKYKQISGVLSIDVDSDGLRNRWLSLFSRFEKVEDVTIEGKMVVLRGYDELLKRKILLSSRKTDGVKKVASDWGSGSADY